MVHREVGIWLIVIIVTVRDWGRWRTERFSPKLDHTLPQMLIIFYPERMIATVQPAVADKLTLAPIDPIVNHQRIVHIEPDPVINAGMEAVGSLAEGPNPGP